VLDGGVVAGLVRWAASMSSSSMDRAAATSTVASAIWVCTMVESALFTLPEVPRVRAMSSSAAPCAPPIATQVRSCKVDIGAR